MNNYTTNQWPRVTATDTPSFPDIIKKLETILAALEDAEGRVYYISVVVTIIALILVIGVGAMVYYNNKQSQ